MDTIPLFLQLVQSHMLFYSVITTGNLHLFDQGYEGKVYYPTNQSIELLDFKLTNEDVFDSVIIGLMPDSTIQISMFTKDSKYYQNPELYFGKTTIYANVESLFAEKGFKPKHPFSYLFKDFSPPVFLLSGKVQGSFYVNLTFGESIAHMKGFQKPTNKNVVWD